MDIKEIKAEDLNPWEFMKESVREIRKIVGNNKAIVALSGGVDSSVVTMLAHKALGKKLTVIFVDNGIMREKEPQRVAAIFKKLGIEVLIVQAQEEFFAALKGITNPEKKREAITQTFYKKVFGRLVKAHAIKFIFHGTILTDVEETVDGIKRQHNIFMQIGIDPQKEFGYQLLEPLDQLRKDGVRKLAKALGLPKSIWNRMPFPGPALVTRLVDKVTPERIALVRKATAIVEEECKNSGAFQYLAILHKDRVTGIKNGKRKFGLQIEVRCWDSVDARKAIPTRLPWETLEKIGQRLVTEIPEVVSATYGITQKPPTTIEAI